MLHLLLISATVGLCLCAATASLVDLLVITQFLGPVKDNDTLQLINGMTSVLKKLLKYFNNNFNIFFFYIVILSFSCNTCFIFKRF